MKIWFTFLLLLLTLAGTCFPCCLADECSDNAFTTSKKEDQQKGEGNCSPFFACANCSGFVQLSIPIQMGRPECERTVFGQTAIQFSLPDYSPSFWQPPRSC